jgi:endonuclease III
MNRKQRAHRIQTILDSLFPNPPIPLKHSDPYTLLIAVLLSAQCTDQRVNQVTPFLFAKASTPQQMITLSIEEIAQIIRTCGLFSTKARAIWQLSQDLIDHYGGQVPQNLTKLQLLPGVGRKTASVVMTQAFGKAAFPVDTHIYRCAHRWKLTSSRSILGTERDLKKLFPKQNWNRLHLQMIYFARQYCPAKGHQPSLCPICSWV